MAINVDRLEIIVEAEAKKAVAELDRLESKLKQVGTAMRGVSGFNLGKGTSTASINSTANSLSRYTKSTASAITGTRSLTAQISRLAFAFYSVKRVISGVGDSIKKSMDFTETVNLFQTTFKKIGMEEAESIGYEWGSESANAFAKGYINRAQNFNDMLTESLGLDPNTMMNYQAVFAQMSNSMGLVTDSALNISESFTMLGNDIASLWNIDTKTAMQKLQSGLAGQIRPLRQLGIDISQTSLEMTAMKYGITDNITQMSQAAKVQLRWLSIMDQSEVAFGDMAKTIDSPANQLRILSQQWSLLSRSIGNVFLPVVQRILPYINAVVIALRNMINTIASAMGYELPDYTDTNIYTDVTDDIDGMTDATDDATAANERLKKSIMGFDELNVLSDNRNSGGNVDSGSGYDNLDDAIQQKTDSYMAKFNEELDKMSNKSKDLAENIQKFFGSVADKIEPTTTAFKKLWDEGLSKLAGFAITNWISFYDKFLVPVGSWVLGEGLPSLFNTINDFINDVDLSVLNTAIGNLYDALAPFAIAIGEGLLAFIDGMADILTPAVNVAIDLLSAGLNAIANAISLIPEDVAIALGGAIGGIATAFLIYNGATAVAGIIKSIGIAMGTMLTTLSTHPILAIGAAMAGLVGAFIALEKAEFNNSEIGKYVQHVEDLVQSSKDLNSEIKTMLDNQDDRNDDIEAEYGAIQKLATKYFELADKQNLTNKENVLLKSYAEELIKKVPELSTLIDEQTGAYKGTKDEINALITSTKEYYLVQAAQESLIEIAKSQYEAEKKLKDLTEERKIAEDKLAETNQEKLDYMNKNIDAFTSMNFGVLSVTDAFKASSVASIEYDDKIKALEGSISDIDRQILDTTETNKKLNDEWNYASGYISTYSSTANKEMPRVSSAVDAAYEAIKKKVQDFKLPDLHAVVRVDRSELDSLFNSAPSNWNINASLFGNIGQHATGGYPTPGQLFIANEPGNPELIGNVGGRTAVMNNNQIVDAVSQGVAVAVASVMGGQGGSQIIHNILKLNDDVVYEAYERAQQSNGFRYAPA